ncbi:AmpG family muropeptide MFS transporter [Robbsia sp. KACC 23696]|uniref:AmpG family muropeptide MFS transporter n=1 Tax=Robbsia sp. KACC 23696 TaxID=3149231 RepID=UPI00325C28C4
MHTPTEEPAAGGWRVYLNTRMLVCAFLGFSSGLPLYVLITLVQAWLRTSGVDLKQIGLFALIGIPYTWKFLWAPLLDRFSPALGRWRPGRRRGWMFIAQIMVALGIAAMGFLQPQLSLGSVATLAFALAFFSASADISIDAYRRELLSDAQQGLGTAIHVNAYKIAALIPGSLSLVLADHLPWSSVFAITAAFMLPGIILSLFAPAATVSGPAPRSLSDAVVLPFREFVARSGWRYAILILAFIFLYKLGDSMTTALATPFYLDLGFTKTQIGLVAKVSSLWASVAGGILGGIWLVRLGIARGLWVFGIAQIASTLTFAWLASRGADATTFDLGWAIAAESFGAGLGTAAFTAFIATTTDPRYTATQFALFTSLASVPRVFINAGTGWIVDRLGWFDFYLLCAVLALPGMALLLKVAPWNTRTR